MSTNPLVLSIETLAKERGIDPTIVIGAIEEAVLTASRKSYGKDGENLKARLNQETGEVELLAVKKVVAEVVDAATEISLEDAKDIYRVYGEEYANGIELDDEIEFSKSKEKLGRIAAQTAKQVIFQKVREAERRNVYEEFSSRVGEVLTGVVKRFEQGDIIVELGRVEASLPRKEQSRAENYSIGDRVRAVIKSVNENLKGPQVIMSRTDPSLLIKLFEQEVPEIYDGTVMIRGAVREAGDRAKVAVFSRERDVDPVGACVGMKGTRVQAIIRELRGEKIDIVEFSEDPLEFVTHAISPARVQRVTIVDDVNRVMEVVVEDKQLSLAIGKKGQNVRLAAKLTGWKIDIKNEEEKRAEVEAQLEGFDWGSVGADAPATDDGEPAAADAADGATEQATTAEATAEPVATERDASEEAPTGDAPPETLAGEAAADDQPATDEAAAGDAPAPDASQDMETAVASAPGTEPEAETTTDAAPAQGAGDAEPVTEHKND